MVIWPTDQLNLTRCLGAGVGQARVKSQESEDAVLWKEAEGRHTLSVSPSSGDKQKGWNDAQTQKRGGK